MHNPTCLVTGKTDNLRMHSIKNDDGDMIGWIFLNESVNIEDTNADIKWMIKANVKVE